MDRKFIFILFMLFIYLTILYILKKKKIFKKYNITLYGPILMIKSNKGLKILKKISSYKKIVICISNICFLLYIIGMLFMLNLMIQTDVHTILEVYTKIIPKVTILNQFKNIFLFPGINDFIPFSWGLIGLIITLIIHEFAHAIVCMTEDIKVKSLGIILLIIPIGGFVEPDNNELYKDNLTSNMEIQKSKTIKIKRLKILSAGVIGNFLIAIASLTIFFGPVLNFATSQNSWVIIDYSKQEKCNLNDNYHIHDYDIVKKINNIDLLSKNSIKKIQTTISNSKDIRLIISNKNISDKVIIINNELETSKFKIFSEIKIDSIDINSPAYYSTLEIGDIIIELNNFKILNIEDLTDAINFHKPLEHINIKTITNNNVLKNNELKLGYKNNEQITPYLGITYFSYSYIIFDFYKIKQISSNYTTEYLKSIKYMLYGYNTKGFFDIKTMYLGLITLISLPIISTLHNNLLDLNIINFNENIICINYLILKNNIYYILSNLMLWVGWMNLYIGLFNCLPAYPLDGGHLLKTIMELIFQKGNTQFKLKVPHYICLFTSVFIYFSFIFTFLWPYISPYIMI